TILDPTSKKSSAPHVACFASSLQLHGSMNHAIENYAENIYTERNHAARQIHHAARGCKSINYAARGNRITRRVIKSEAIFIFNQDFTPRVVKYHAARSQVREQPSS
ncbi:hypothetical protein A2U01_0020210, partial [Trifolium medium]|nr:hypothetical protein [Trifolium medium]